MNEIEMKWQQANEEEIAYSSIRWAMNQVLLCNGEPSLRMLKNAIYFANEFLENELEELEDKVKELGLDKWLTKKRKK